MSPTRQLVKRMTPKSQMQARGNSVIIDIKRPRFPSKPVFKPTAAHFAGKGCIGQSCLYNISRPLLWTMWLLGKLPYSISEGWMKSSFVSLSFVHSLAMLILNVGSHLYYRDELQMAVQELMTGITFSRVLFATSVLIQTSTIFLSVYSWIFEVPSIVRNYNTSAALEKKLNEVFPTCVLSPKWRKTACMVQIVSFASFFVFDQYLMTMRYHDKPVPMVFLLVFNLSGNQLFAVMWSLNTHLAAAKAGKLREYLDQVLQNGTGGAQSLKTCRKAWMALWELSQTQSQAFSTSLIWCMGGYGVILVTSAYGLIVSTKKFDVDELLGTIPYFVTSGTMVFAIIESAHHAKNKVNYSFLRGRLAVRIHGSKIIASAKLSDNYFGTKMGDEFLRDLINVDKDTIDRECAEEAEDFTNLILRTDKAQFTLKGYFTVGRPLFISFLSTTVTYLIVLLQFQQSEEKSQLKLNHTLEPMIQ